MLDTGAGPRMLNASPIAASDSRANIVPLDRVPNIGRMCEPGAAIHVRHGDELVLVRGQRFKPFPGALVVEHIDPEIVIVIPLGVCGTSGA